MKKTIYVFLTMITCILFMTGCSFFSKTEGGSEDDTRIETGTDQDSDELLTTEEEGVELPVGNPQDDSSSDEPASSQTTAADNDSSSKEEPSSNPRDNIAKDPSKEYTGTGKYCGFIDSNSVEIELADGSYCSFFVFEEEVRNTLSALNEENMPEISFSYKAKDGQINPEMTSVIGG